MDEAKVPGQPEEMCGDRLQWTSMLSRGNNNIISRREAGIALMVYA